MNGEAEGRDDTTCDVCGEDCIDTDFIDLKAWQVIAKEGDGLSFYPVEEPTDLFGASWEDVNSTHWVHRECIALFFEGYFASLPVRRAEEG